MNAMTETNTKTLQWFAVRMKARQNGGRRTTVLNAEYESYVGRDGKPRKRQVRNTGLREFVPALILRRAGFEVFLPIKKVWRVKNRHTKEKHLVDVPLLVDWMFVGWSADEARFHELMSFEVVSGVMGTGGRPVRFSHGKVMDLMRRWSGKYLPPEYHRYMRTGMEFGPGSDVVVLEGPFKDFSAKVIEISGPSARIAIQIFGRDIELGVDARNVRAG